MRAGRIALIITLLLSVLPSLQAQETDSINSIVDQINGSGVIRVNQPEKMALEMRRVEGASYTAVETETDDVPAVRAGYRVQVFDDNNPRTAHNQAEHVRREVTTHFPHYNAYISFNSPYWRVKAGDFRSRAEAEQALAEIKAAIPRLTPYLRIVRDKINNPQ